ncbi:acetyl-CoA carboxylase biotin carboxylase subunit [Corynebacterium hylobatis]|uniref:biotin carboxylase n=1 Tax=Corynebacterium hylobatis TaxID=1859290 RepID=A0A430HYR5_9CORY|nr:acetyl-CoA carboxylase biotin carboxylase subunit [Corynebacterium hylobatis]RSZ63840.1 acetyl-CoA carboxylase biotin carboxylase subunit [Corynebacterium hylobatis]
MFNKILIANRGEIAVRIMATCADLGIKTVAVYSAADSESLHVRRADEAVNLGDGPSSENYLNIPAIIDAALKTGAEAIHPGYGFLAENAEFARAVAAAGLVFIGPSGDAISAMGEKVTARELAVAAEVPLAPGSNGAIEGAEQVLAFGEEHGYPVLVKASHGGGGRGMRRINSADEAAEAVAAAEREAAAAFGNSEIYLERYLTNARHVEVQVFADTHGNAVYFGDRDCSVQRRHQKLIEEAPAPGLSEKMRKGMGEAAVRLARRVGYVGAGTVEFLVEGEKFYFLEMNTRIQVEHPVTELVQGLDLIAEQIRVAAGQPLSVTESGLPPRGAAIEARINAEDINGGRFVPTPGKITALKVPSQPGLRFDTGFEAGDEVLPYYDSLIGKLIAWGPDRESAINRLSRALDELDIQGVKTTAPAAKLVLEHEDFRATRFNTLWLESTVEFPDVTVEDEDEDDEGDELLARNEVEVGGRFYAIPYFTEAVPGAPVAAGAAPAEAPTNGGAGRPRTGGGRRKAKKAFDGTVKAPMQGTIVQIKVSAGQQVSAGDLLFVQEAMKMENPITAPADGTVGEILVGLGESLAAGAALTTLELEKVNA